jgi:hypothetical protein
MTERCSSCDRPLLWTHGRLLCTNPNCAGHQQTQGAVVSEDHWDTLVALIGPPELRDPTLTIEVASQLPGSRPPQVSATPAGAPFARASAGNARLIEAALTVERAALASQGQA